MQDIPLPPSIPFQTRTLTNGLRVVTARRTGTGTAAVQVWYKVGGKDDPQGKAGFAHLFEHLMFKRTRNLPDEAIDRLTEDIGGENNAYTTPDVTVYHEIIPANHLQVLLWAEAERMRNLLVTGKAFTSEREVVKEEYRQGILAPPYGRFDDAVERLAWKVHPYRNTVIGNIPELDAATLQDVRRFHKDFYRPDNAVLVVAGDFDTNAVERWIDQTFGAIPKAPSPAATQRPTEPERTRSARHTVASPNIPLPAVAVGYRTPDVRSEDRHALTLLDSVLASGKASRLHRELVQRQQLASEAISWIDLRTDAGLIQIRTVAAQGVAPEKLENAIEAIVADLRDNLVPETELGRVRNRLLTDELKQRETVDGIASLLGDAMVNHDDPAWADRRWEFLTQVTPETLRDAARKVLSPENRVTVVGTRGPAPNPVQSTPSPNSARDTAAIPPPDQNPPKPGRPTAPAARPSSRRKLQNKLTVVHTPRPGSGLVSIAVGVRHGTALDPDGQWGRATLLADVMTRGTARRDAERIATDAEALGGTVGARASRDDIRFTITVPASRLEPALELLAEIVRYPRFAPTDVIKARNELTDTASIALQDPGSIAALAIARRVYGNSPQGCPVDGLPTTLGRVQRNQLIGLWSKTFRPEDTVLVVAGDCSPEAAFTIADRLLGTWSNPNRQRPTGNPALPPTDRRRRPLLIGIPGVGQAAVAVAVPTLARRDPEFTEALVANSVLGGGFSARLNREIRVRRGLAYGAFSVLSTERLPGMLVMAAQTRNNTAPEVAQVMCQQLDALTQSPLGSDELEKRKAALLGPLARRLETGDGTVGSLLTLELLGLPATELEQLPRRIANASAQNIQSAAKNRFPTDKLQIVVVGDPAICRAGLKARFGNLDEISLSKLDLQHPDLGLAVR